MFPLPHRLRIIARQQPAAVASNTPSMISTLDFRVEQTVAWVRNGEPQMRIRHHKVALGGSPGGG